MMSEPELRELLVLQEERERELALAFGRLMHRYHQLWQAGWWLAAAMFLTGFILGTIVTRLVWGLL